MRVGVSKRMNQIIIISLFRLFEATDFFGRSVLILNL